MKRIKNSGRGKMFKGDAEWQDTVIDIKEYSKSFSISRDKWIKICSDAYQTNAESEPTLMLVLGEGQTRVRLAVVSWATWQEVWQFWKENRS